MTDVAVEWDTDFVVDSTGDLLLVDGDAEVRQRIERRLFTAVNGYVWHPEYGAGLPQKIGSLLSATQIQSVVMAQINLESTVATNPAPQISTSAQPGGIVIISIQYWDALTGVSVSFQITA